MLNDIDDQRSQNSQIQVQSDTWAEKVFSPVLGKAHCFQSKSLSWERKDGE